MRTALFFAAATVCLQAHAQFPYFLEDHSGNNINYSQPVDIDFDGSSTVYSLHSSSPGPGMIVTKYSSTTGAVIDVSYIIRGNASLKPVRVRTLGGNYYVLCNAVSGAGVAGYALVCITASGNVVNWSFALFPPTGGASRNAVDFILDGGSNAYILTNAYDAANNQNDIGVTNVNITGTPSLVWDNIYQNTTRSEDASNIVYRSASNELIVSAISADLISPATDRGPMVMRLSTGGGYTASMLYKYGTGCNHPEPNGTWVALGSNNFYLSSTSIDNGANGPLWLAKINPVSMGINIQSNHPTGSAYLEPEIQGVFATSGTQILVSGSSAAASGYVHLEFSTSALSFSSGVVYPATNAQNGSPIYDTYIATGTGMNIFSVADNVASQYHYYLFKTSDFGRNDCDDPYQVTPDNCTMSPYAISFTQVPIALVTAAPVFTTSARSNSIIQSCYVPFIVAPGNESREAQAALSTELSVSPNPTNGAFTLSAGKSTLSNIELFNPDGKAVPAEINETPEGARVNLTGRKAGIYLIQALVNGEPKTVRVVLE